MAKIRDEEVTSLAGCVFEARSSTMCQTLTAKFLGGDRWFLKVRRAHQALKRSCRIPRHGEGVDCAPWIISQQDPRQRDTSSSPPRARETGRAGTNSKRGAPPVILDEVDAAPEFPETSLGRCSLIYILISELPP